MKTAAFLLAFWFLTLSITNLSRSPLNLDHSPVEVETLLTSSHSSETVDSDHSDQACPSAACHLGICQVLIKDIAFNFHSLLFDSSGIFSNQKKPSALYLEGNRKPPKLS